MTDTGTGKQDSQQFKSIEQFVTALTTEDKARYGDIIRSANFSNCVFEDYSSWCDDSYTRNCIADNDEFELILLCWKEGQITPIHDHGGEECWVRIIKGEFRETIYTSDDAGKLNIKKTIISKADDTTYMIDFMGFHTIENLSSSKSMSLHLYAKPIRSCNIFDHNSRKFVAKDLAYDTVPQLELIEYK